MIPVKAAIKIFDKPTSDLIPFISLNFSICMFVAIFIYMDKNMVTPSTIFTVFLASTATGYVIIILLNLLSKKEVPMQTGEKYLYV